MQIISSFKDYYDFQSNLYGVDKSIVYNRKMIGTSNNEGVYYKKEVIHDTWERLSLKEYSGYVSDTFRSVGSSGNTTSPFSWLVFCGKPYPLVKIKDKFELVNENIHSSILLNGSRRLIYRERVFTEVGKQTSHLIELSRKVGHPVFIVDRTVNLGSVMEIKLKDNFKSFIECKCPNLGEIGFARIYRPEQVYQDLCYFMANTIKESPDTMKPSILSDKEKILQHGFDIKQSFRHRIPN